jgi:hypothetical protein
MNMTINQEYNTDTNQQGEGTTHDAGCPPFVSKNQEQISKHLCPKNVYSITYASPPKKMHKVDGFRPAFITFAPDEK